MMDAKETVKCIEDVLSSDYHYDESLGYQLTSDDFEWLEEAKEALEKQTPKKPIYDSKMPRCPSCRSWIQNNESIQKYCNFCGQAIDWSDEK